MTVTKPLDLTGVNPATYVRGELHTVSEAQFRDYSFLIPTYAPFYVDNFQLFIKEGETLRELVEDVDFSFALSYVTGTRTTGKNLYGAVTLHNLDANGVLFTNYQPLGGDHVADRLQVLTTLADKAYNPRTTIWDVVTNVPDAFTPVPHYQDYDTIFGQDKVIDALVMIRDAIIQNSSLTSDTIRNFMDQQAGAQGGYVLRNGDQMSGPLLLVGYPGADDHAVSKAYVDERLGNLGNITSLLSRYVLETEFHRLMGQKIGVTGGTMTGHLSLASDPLEDSQAVTKRYVDQTARELMQAITQLQQQVTAMTESNNSIKEYIDNRVDEVFTRYAIIK